MKRILASVAAAGLLLSIVSGVLPTAAAAQCSAGLSASEGGGCVGNSRPDADHDRPRGWDADHDGHHFAGPGADGSRYEFLTEAIQHRG